MTAERDLATMLGYIDGGHNNRPSARAAHHRVEAELARLQESERIGEMRRVEGKRILDERNEWMTPFDGSGIEWHESLPNPYTYQASDFAKLVAAVHEYECRALAAEAALADIRRTLINMRKWLSLMEGGIVTAPDLNAILPDLDRAIAAGEGIGPTEEQP